MIENLPIRQITQETKRFEEANLYYDAGMVKKGEFLQLKTLESLKVPLLRIPYKRQDCWHPDSQRIWEANPQKYEGWRMYEIDEYMKAIPCEILKQMINIRDKKNLFILIHDTKPDPLLIFHIPWKYYEDWYIILEKWE